MLPLLPMRSTDRGRLRRSSCAGAPRAPASVHTASCACPTAQPPVAGKASPLGAAPVQTPFPRLRTVFSGSIVTPFRAAAVVCVTSSTSANCSILGTFYTLRNKETSLGRGRVSREGRARGPCVWGRNCRTPSAASASVTWRPAWRLRPSPGAAWASVLGLRRPQGSPSQPLTRQREHRCGRAPRTLARRGTPSGGSCRGVCPHAYVRPFCPQGSSSAAAFQARGD